MQTEIYILSKQIDCNSCVITNNKIAVIWRVTFSNAYIYGGSLIGEKLATLAFGGKEIWWYAVSHSVCVDPSFAAPCTLLQTITLRVVLQTAATADAAQLHPLHNSQIALKSASQGLNKPFPNIERPAFAALPNTNHGNNAL